MGKIQKMLALTIQSLGFSTTGRNMIVNLIRRYKFGEAETLYGFEKKDRKILERLASKFIVKDYIEATNKWFETNPPHLKVWSRGVDEVMRKKLIEHGFTQLDWIELPNSTVTVEMLRKLGKKELLKQSVLLLGTLTNIALESLDGFPEKITIGDFLQTSERKWMRGWSAKANCWMSLKNTREKLLQLGFTYEDGVFLQDGTKRQLVESLMKHDGLSKKNAALVAEIAEKRGWAKPFR